MLDSREYNEMEASTKRLREFFGGKAYIEFNLKFFVYRIVLRTDDLINDFVYDFPYFESITRERKNAELQKMIDKYIKQMEIEQQLLKKRVLKYEKFN